MGRKGILLMHRITNLSNVNARFSASINDNECVDSIWHVDTADDSLANIFSNNVCQTCNGEKNVAMPSV